MNFPFLNKLINYQPRIVQKNWHTVGISNQSRLKKDAKMLIKSATTEKLMQIY